MTTDFRDVFTEVLTKQLGVPSLKERVSGLRREDSGDAYRFVFVIVRATGLFFKS